MTIAPDVSFTLEDRYEAMAGEVLVTGIQALARVPLDQMRADRLAGWKTAAYVSGYQGSPLGGFDRELLNHGDLHRLSQSDCLDYEKLWKIYWWGGHRDEGLVRALERFPKLVDIANQLEGSAITTGERD